MFGNRCAVAKETSSRIWADKREVRFMFSLNGSWFSHHSDIPSRACLRRQEHTGSCNTSIRKPTLRSSSQLCRAGGCNHGPTHNRKRAAVGRKPIGNLAIISGLEHRQIGVLARFERSLSLL